MLMLFYTCSVISVVCFVGLIAFFLYAGSLLDDEVSDGRI